jgi:ABC-type lipoprotein release transport system permease subunit
VLFDSIFKSQRREMGILKAEGIYNRELSYRFVFNLFVLLLIGAIVGIVVGYYLSIVLSNLLLGLYSVPVSGDFPPDFKTNILIVSGVIIVVLSLVYLFAIRKNLRKKPLVLIKNINSEKNPKLNISKLTKRFSFKTKYTISIFVRNFFMTIMLSIGVLVSSFMLLFGTLMLSSIHDMTSDTYTKMFKYDYTVTYSAGYTPDYDEYSTISYTTDIVSMSNGYEVESETKIPLYGYDVSSNDLIDLYTPNGKEIPSSAYETGIVLSAGLATHYDLEIGDTIVVENPVDVEEEVSLEVTAIADDGFGMKAYMDISYMQTLFDLESDFSNGAVYLGDKNDEIISNDPKAQITSAVDLSSSMNENIKVMYTMVGMITIMSSIIAFITMSSISILVINNNRKTISVMKVLGYTTKEIRKMTTGVYKWIVVIVYFGSIPLVDYLINALIANAMKEMDFTIAVNLDLKFAMFGFVVIFAIYFLSMRFAQRSISKIKLSESLKTDE